MLRRLFLAWAVLAAMGGAAGCGPGVDLSKALELTDIVTGYYDGGLVDGANHLVPSLSFRLHNSSDSTLAAVQLVASFWQEGADGEWDSVLVASIGSVRAGGATESHPHPRERRLQPAAAPGRAVPAQHVPQRHRQAVRPPSNQHLPARRVQDRSRDSAARRGGLKERQKAEGRRQKAELQRPRLSNATSVTSASRPSVKANSRNVVGEPALKWSTTNAAAPPPLSTGPKIHR